MIRTRFAPSPTGLLHIGGIRTALFSWAFARKYQGRFILRIEDTDRERSSDEATAVILEGMRWLGLDYDEGPFYQTHRLPHYRRIIAQWLDMGQAYRCYCSEEELDTMRARQKKAGEKPLYDRRCRPKPGESPPKRPQTTPFVVRFKTPLEGDLSWDDQVKGQITIKNSELDDLILARTDGSPTYNFCVVVDDSDMKITHVIRGDDHINNTPRQIHLYHALEAPLPCFAHLPMILNQAGHKMSKRHDTVSVLDYATKGYLPEALLNYLARLGWGHGDDEFFTLKQFIAWFDLGHISQAACRFDPKKLLWLNAQHLKAAAPETLAQYLPFFLEKQGVTPSSQPALPSVCALLQTRCQTLLEMASQAAYFYQRPTLTPSLIETYLSPTARAHLDAFAKGLKTLPQWDVTSLSHYLKTFITQENIKMPALGLPLRIQLCGTPHTPPLDAVMAILGREEILHRLNQTQTA